MKKGTQVTTTTLVEEAFRETDDFLTAADLIQRTGRSMNQVSAALFHLRKHRAIDVMPVEGRLYWYATPTEDTRSRRIAEYTPAPKKRKPKPRKQKIEDIL